MVRQKVTANRVRLWNLLIVIVGFWYRLERYPVIKSLITYAESPALCHSSNLATMLKVRFEYLVSYNEMAHRHTNYTLTLTLKLILKIEISIYVYRASEIESIRDSGQLRPKGKQLRCTPILTQAGGRRQAWRFGEYKRGGINSSALEMSVEMHFGLVSIAI